MELDSVTLHSNGTFGIMYRDDGELKCTCGWPGEEDTSRLWATWELAEKEGRLVHGEKPVGTENLVIDTGCTLHRAVEDEEC